MYIHRHIYSQYISITMHTCFIFYVYMYNKRYPYVFLKYAYITCNFTKTGLTVFINHLLLYTQSGIID